MNDQSVIRDWCEQQNSQDGAFAKSVWYFTIPDGNGGFTTVRADGLDAEEIRKAARGKFPEYAGWPPDKMRQHVGLIKYRLQMGMSEPSFQSIATRWPKESAQPKRQAGIGLKIEEQPA